MGKTIDPMDVVSNSRVEEMPITLGVQTQSISCDDFHLLNSTIAFKISSVKKDERHDENHFRRFIRYTPSQSNSLDQFQLRQGGFQDNNQMEILLMVLPQMVLPLNRA